MYHINVYGLIPTFPQDINDEIPQFRNPLYVAEISENAQRNTPVTWLGRDTVAEVRLLMMMLMVDVDGLVGTLWCRRRIWDIMRLR